MTTLYCTECVGEWKLARRANGESETQGGFIEHVAQWGINEAVALVTMPSAIPVGNGQAAMMPIMRLLCVEHIEVMSPTQQKLLGT